MIPQLESSASQLEELRKQTAELNDKFMRERGVRRRLHEQLQQLRGNIRVMCRWVSGAAVTCQLAECDSEA
jgi:kinesin family protein C2/C3